ncbi:FAD-dependent oxidoreductase [Gramella sp. AN32]|uniref:NAD(P)/FAD-dependent oxidoreductase n=1 Tax=Christiangramia antarctica TaxID=2058158 RepID=A0ABW5X1W9_9FLAO|nr:FAD-dependent oxidoreductase [Gramella sp. AN32]MCM4155688.1 amino acid dehydrogenase [Gramella sp. AN32]
MKVAVIGGGIIGLCTAYYLVKEGVEVTLIDKGNITSGASFVNAGYLTPSHIIPLSEPGIVVKGLKWMLKTDSPFYIKPRFDVDFFKWALRFNGSATQQKVEKAVPVLKEFNLKSRDLFDEIRDSLDFDFHYQNKGILSVFKTEKAAVSELKIAALAHEEGLDVKEITKDELQKLQSVFSEEVLGAIHYTCDRHSTPGTFMENMKKWLIKRGVTFEMNQEVIGFEKSEKNIVSIKTQEKNIIADEFVLASGSWTTRLARKLQLNIPIQPGKGYSINVPRDLGISIPAILCESKVAVTPMDGFTRFAGTMEFSGANEIIRKNRVEAIANAASSYYKNLEITPEEKGSAKCGLRPVSPDGLPFIGKTSKYKNLTVASGHSMMGWSMGPATGKMVSDMITEKPLFMKTSAFIPERFA